VVVVGSFDRSYIRPYSTLIGELVLGGVVIGMVVVVAWMQSMAAARPVPRFLEADRRSTIKLPETGLVAGPAQSPAQSPVQGRVPVRVPVRETDGAG